MKGGLDITLNSFQLVESNTFDAETREGFFSSERSLIRNYWDSKLRENKDKWIE